MFVCLWLCLFFVLVRALLCVVHGCLYVGVVVSLSFVLVLSYFVLFVCVGLRERVSLFVLLALFIFVCWCVCLLRCCVRCCLFVVCDVVVIVLTLM